MKILISSALLAAVLLGQAPEVKPPTGEAAPGYQNINPEDCRAWLTRLASEEFEGRETGMPGYQKAADMVAAHFKDIGLKPVGDKDANGAPTYFQNVPFVAVAVDVEHSKFEATGGKDPIKLKFGEGFGALESGTLSAHGPLAIVVVNSNQDKIPDFDVKGKVVIVVAVGADGEPGAAPKKVYSELRKAGASAIVRVDDVAAARGVEPSNPLRKDQLRMTAPPDKPAIPVVSKAVVQSLATASGRDLAATMAKTKSSGEAVSISTKLTAAIEIASTMVDIAVPNVVGYLEGSDPTLKNELVIIGSHLDHLGRPKRSGKIHPGADDDGSGSTGVLAVSRAFTKNARAPKRSILFMTFCGEEEGLLGSGWYVGHPIFPHESVMAELQMDMIGRREEAHPSENPGNETADQNVNSLHLIGAKKIAPALNDIIEQINKDHVGFDFEYDQEGVYYRSDHYNFALKGIPIAFFFTGFHRDYHQTTDTVDKIDFPKLARVAQLVYLAGWQLAERPDRLPVEKRKKPEKEK